MDRAEVLGILSVLKAAYPNSYRGMTATDAEAMVRLWCDIFRDDSTAAVGEAVKAFISEDKSGFPPTPGQIRAKIPHNRRAISGPVNIDPKWLEYRKKYAELMEKRRAAGVPASFEEAQNAGLSQSEYMKMMDEAGLGTFEIIEEIWGRA